MIHINYKGLIVQVVDMARGIKRVDLFLKCHSEINTKFDSDAFKEALNQLVEKEEILEINYKIPMENNETFQFYLPRQAKIIIGRQKC